MALVADLEMLEQGLSVDTDKESPEPVDSNLDNESPKEQHIAENPSENVDDMLQWITLLVKMKVKRSKALLILRAHLMVMSPRKNLKPSLISLCTAGSCSLATRFTCRVWV